MELLIILAILAPIILGTSVKVWSNFTDGKYQIDKTKNPTLYRLQRLNQYMSNEQHKLWTQEQERKQLLKLDQMETENHNEITKALAEVNTKHKNAIDDWDRDFAAIDAEKRKAAELAAWQEKQRIEAERREKERQATEERNRLAYEKAKAEQEARQLELAQWTATEVARQRSAAKKILESNSDGWEPLVSPSRRRAIDESSYGTRKINVHLVNVREYPATSAKQTGRLEIPDIVQVTHWASGENLYGNSIWFKVEDQHGEYLGWIWSGAVDKQSTSGIKQELYPIKRSLKKAAANPEEFAEYMKNEMLF
jgi:hypothetical protein